MATTITVTLTGKAETQFANVKYSLDLGNGICTHSQVINHCLEEHALFEEFTDDQLTNWLSDNYPEKYKAFLQSIKKPEVKVMAANPSKRFVSKDKRDGKGKR